MEKARIWQQEIEIPTYTVSEPCDYPMFLENRVYQGSSGKVYPNKVIESIDDTKVMKTYQAVFLENQYIQIMILPELGGRVQRAYDKTNGYDFVYYNQVIKPALVGLTGPWISGGIEFNWPQHHRPSTFEPMTYRLETHEDGVTIWVGEIEKMSRTKGQAGFTLYHDKAYLEITGQIYNRTPHFQTFLWWANPAVSVNDTTRTIFPPDVTAVMDHGKRDVSTFPIATGTYYKVDYSEGVDISLYKNIPVPTSYMAYHSEHDFLAFYDESKQAGLLHVANHHIAPGKKQWTWGCGEFGQAWDKHLTDEDGPYIELMTGCFTDNQPDFAWLAPFEEKKFKQYFMPYKEIGTIKNANKDGALAVEEVVCEDDLGRSEATKVALKVGVYVTSAYEQVQLILETKRHEQQQKIGSLSPLTGFWVEFEMDKETTSAYTLKLLDQRGEVIVDYQHGEIEAFVPQKAEAIEPPNKVESLEDLYLFGLHLEQYRHATRRPEDYYEEGLKRDNTDYRINVAYGKRMMHRYQLTKAKEHFQTAIHKITRSNPNPYEGEAYYQLGLVCRYLDEDALAYTSFYKCIWNQGMKASGYYHIAAIDYKKGRFIEALEAVEESLNYQNRHMKARHLKYLILLALGKEALAQQHLKISLEIDGLDVGLNWELALIEKEQQISQGIDDDTLIELVLDYIEWGDYKRAMACLEGKENIGSYLLYYYQAYVALLLGETDKCLTYMAKGEALGVTGVFPYRIEDGKMLEALLKLQGDDGLALYGLGNLYYHNQWYEAATKVFETIKPLKKIRDMAFVYRNLSLLYYNQQKDETKALSMMEQAILCDPQDSHLRMEYDQLLKKCRLEPSERLLKLKQVMNLVPEKDALYLEYCSLLTLTGEFNATLLAMENFHFHPWEGGEGKSSSLYKWAQVAVALFDMRYFNYQAACERLEALKQPYPEFLGEGRLTGTLENHIDFWLGMAYRRLGNEKKALLALKNATNGHVALTSMLFYNDQPPEMLFYQGLAYAQLNEYEKAYEAFKRLFDYGIEHREDEQIIDYFSVSIPDLQLFSDSLEIKNQIHCDFIATLGAWGLAWLDEENAIEMALSYQAMKECLQRDPNHLSLSLHVQMLESRLLPELLVREPWQVTMGRNAYPFDSSEDTYHPTQEGEGVSKKISEKIQEEIREKIQEEIQEEIKEEIQIANKAMMYLPGTTDLAQLGQQNLKQSNFHLIRRYPFVGVCLYEQEIEIPIERVDQKLLLILERTKMTKVYLDGQCVSEGEALSISQVHLLSGLGKLKPGRHIIGIEVNNDIDSWSQTAQLKRHGHMLTEHTQTNWNGILGRIELTYVNEVAITRVAVKKDGHLSIHIHGADSPFYLLQIECEGIKKSWPTKTLESQEKGNKVVFEVAGAFEGLFQDEERWSEHQPKLKSITVSILKGKEVLSQAVIHYGERLVEITKHHIMLNGKPIFLRGDNDCSIFPLTGAPPMDVHFWKQRFKIYKEFGFNHVRFHSWCPPEAAFVAADELGLYLQVEMSYFATQLKESDSELQAQILKEAEEILKAYSAHPSFLIFAIGNEMAGDMSVFDDIVKTIKSWNYSILIAPGSNNFIGETLTSEQGDLWVTMRVPVQDNLENIRASYAHADLPLGFIQEMETIGTRAHYDQVLEHQKCPVISHEIGQYQVYPRCQEAKDYTGVLRATALESFTEQLNGQKSLMAMADDYFVASGQTAYLCYKEELEAAFRSQYLAGFQLLSLFDFPGQGTALVGLFDSLFHSKGIVDSATWRQSCGPMVILGLFDKYVWMTTETLEVDVLFVNDGTDILEPQRLKVSFGDEVKELNIEYPLEPGHRYTLGTVTFTISQLDAPKQVGLNLDYAGVSNSYSLFVYPALNEDRISLDDEVLEQGKDISAEAVIDEPILFPTDFWNYKMFKALCLERDLTPAPGTMGLWIQQEHPIFQNFPTASYGQWQWQRLMTHAKPMDVLALRERYGDQVMPIVHVIDHFQNRRELAILVELKEEKRILCSIDFLKGQDYPEFHCLMKSMMTYIKEGLSD